MKYAGSSGVGPKTDDPDSGKGGRSHGDERSLAGFPRANKMTSQRHALDWLAGETLPKAGSASLSGDG